MHDRILSRVLPLYGVIYLPLSFPIFEGPPDLAISEKLQGTPQSVKDCTRKPWSGFSDSLELVFFNGLSAILALHHF